MKALHTFALLLLGLLILSACSRDASQKAGTGTNAAPATNSSSGGILTAPVDYLGAIGKAKQTAVKTVDIASINQAIQMFKVEEGRNPKDLNELVQEKYLPRIPDAPYGMKIVYDAVSASVRVVPQ